MTPAERTDAVVRQVRHELLEHLHDLQKYGPDYITAYVEAIIGSRTTRRPKSHMHPKLAELVRELALDAAVMDRRTCGAVASPSPSSEEVVSRSRPSRRQAPARCDFSVAETVEKPEFAGTMVV